MRQYIPEIRTTMEEDLRAIGLGDLLGESVEVETVEPTEDNKNRVQEALERFRSKRR